MTARAVCAIGVGLLLAACGSNNPPAPPPPPPPRPFSGLIAPSQFVVTQSDCNGVSAIHTCTYPNVDGSIALPQCANASVCWLAYVEANLGLVSLTGRPSVSMTYTISGVNPTFDCETPNNNANCGLPNQVGGWPPTVRLFLHRYGDQGTSPVFDAYRWFSNYAPLALGTNTLTQPLSLNGFVPVYNTGANQAQFPAALAAIGSVGFVFGGGSFASHGVAIPKGNATFTVNSYTVN